MQRSLLYGASAMLKALRGEINAASEKSKDYWEKVARMLAGELGNVPGTNCPEEATCDEDCDDSDCPECWLQWAEGKVKGNAESV